MKHKILFLALLLPLGLNAQSSIASGEGVEINAPYVTKYPARNFASDTEQDRAQVGSLSKATQEATGQGVKIAYADQGYTGKEPTQAARDNDIELAVVKLTEAKRGFVLLPKRWVVEQTFGWLSRFRNLARDYERLASSLESMHWLAVLGLFLSSAVKLDFI